MARQALSPTPDHDHGVALPPHTTYGSDPVCAPHGGRRQQWDAGIRLTGALPRPRGPGLRSSHRFRAPLTLGGGSAGGDPTVPVGTVVPQGTAESISRKLR